MGWVLLFGFILILMWAGVIGYLSNFMDELANPYPSAKAIHVLKKYIRKVRQRQLSPDLSICEGTEKRLTVQGREVILRYGDISIPLSEDDGKILTIHLLTVYPEMENSDFVPVFVRQRPTLDYYAKHNGGPVWC